MTMNDRSIVEAHIGAAGIFSKRLSAASLGPQEIYQLLSAAMEVARLAGQCQILPEEDNTEADQALDELQAAVDTAWLKALPCPTPWLIVHDHLDRIRNEPPGDGEPRKLRLVEPAEPAPQG